MLRKPFPSWQDQKMADIRAERRESVNTVKTAPGWRGISVEGQSVIQYELPGNMNDRMTVVLFLRDPLSGTPRVVQGRSPGLFSARTMTISGLWPPPGTRDGLIEASVNNALPRRPYADAVLLTRKGIYGSLRFADCIPVVGVSWEPFDWCLLLHSGFVGTCRKAIREAVEQTSKKTGLQGLLNSTFWVGPGIGPCCYFRKAEDPLTMMGVKNLPSECWKKDGERVYFDLPKANIIFLYDMGIPGENIRQIDVCTSCSVDICHSFRKGDDLERSFLMAVIHPRFHKKTHWWENMFKGQFVPASPFM